MIAHETRLMLRAHRYGALCTLSTKLDYPFGSITPCLMDQDASALILISTLAEHTNNIRHDPRISLITHDQDSPHIHASGLTVTGNVVLEPDRNIAGLRYFLEAKTYLSMHDFHFYLIRPLAIRRIGGFRKTHWIDIRN